MSHFYELFLDDKINYHFEIDKISSLFLKESFYIYHNDAGRSSLGDFINKYYFRQLKVSHNYLSLRTYLADIISYTEDEPNQFVVFCEAILSIIEQFLEFDSDIEYEEDVKNITNKIEEIRKIISIDLKYLNLVIKKIKNDLGDIVILIPNDQLLEKALLAIDDKNVRRYLIEYCSSNNNGNVDKKTELLRLLENYIEGITKNKQLRQMNERLFEETDFLYNNLDLRHNVEVEDKYFFNKTLSEREKWLDITYHESLLVINAREEANNHKLIRELRATKK